MIIVNGKTVWQLTDSGTGQPQTKTEEQRIADGWPPPDGTPVMKAEIGTGLRGRSHDAR